MTQPWITLWDDVELCWKVVDSNDFEETIATVGKVAKYGAIPGNVKMITLAPQMYKIIKQMLELMRESEGIAGYHKNGNVLKWEDVDFVEDMISISNNINQ